jgi:multicomponent Na+:H+ antiporter subunit D
MSNLIAWVVLIPLVTAVLVLPFTGRPELQRRIALASGALLLALIGWVTYLAVIQGEILVLPLGNWAPRVGIVWVVDALAAIMISLTAITSFAMLLYAGGSLRGYREAKYVYPLHQLLLMGIYGSFVTGDFFNLFVFFEIMLLASFALISLGARPRQLNQTFPYVLINLVASAVFLAGVGAVYGTAGTVNMAEVSHRIATGELPGAFWAGISLVLLVFAIKTALVPVFFWLPDSYPEAPIPIAGLFAGLLTKVGVYTLFRSVPLITGTEPGGFHAFLVFVAAATMLIGVLGALGRNNIREILSFHIISQVGYMVFGLALYTPLAVAAGLFYIVHHIIVKSALFFAGGIAERVGGSGMLGGVSGMAKTHPWVAVGFFIPAMALAGLPPFSGFWGKFFLIVAGFQVQAWAATAIAILVSLLTLASMLKIWTYAFWGAPGGQVEPKLGHNRGMVGATLLLAGLSVGIGVAAPPLFHYSEIAAAQLLAVTPYVDAVVGVGGIDASVVAHAGGESIVTPTPSAALASPVEALMPGSNAFVAGGGSAPETQPSALGGKTGS